MDEELIFFSLFLLGVAGADRARSCSIVEYLAAFVWLYGVTGDSRRVLILKKLKIH